MDMEEEDLDTFMKSLAKYSNVLKALKANKITHVDAGWVNFNIVYNPGQFLYDGEACHGLVNFDTYQLKLNSLMSDELALETLVHEIYHILFATVGYSDDRPKGEFCNEDLTIQTSRGWLLLYRLNPKLMTIISEFMARER